MTDYSLLLKAGKAIGIKVVKLINSVGTVYYHARDGGNQYPWNPLEHSGDAFDLAADLRMSIDCDDYANLIIVYSQDGELVVTVDVKDDDVRQAVREGIVQCAVKVAEKE